MISQTKLNAALLLLARSAGGKLLRCAATRQIMFDTPRLAGRAARLLHIRHPEKRWQVVPCGRGKHYHLKREDDTR